MAVLVGKGAVDTAPTMADLTSVDPSNRDPQFWTSVNINF